MEKYSRVTFDRSYVRIDGHSADATLIHPGHPLMAALLSVVLDRHASELRSGAVLLDRHDPALSPYVVCLLEHDVTDGRFGRDGRPQVVSRRAQYVRVDPDGSISPLAQTPIPNLDVPDEAERVLTAQILREPWAAAADLDQMVVAYASSNIALSHLEEVSARTKARVEKTTRLVRERLQHEINFWDRRAHEIREGEKAGKATRLPADQAAARAEELSRRMARRLIELEHEGAIAATPPRVAGATLVVPAGWFTALTDPEGAEAHARETARVERIAVDSVLEIERALGHLAVEMPHNNPGYDIESETPSGLDFIEVKGRVEGGNTFVLTRQEAVTALNKRDHSVLALVRVHPDGGTTVRYVREPMGEPIPPWQSAIEADWDYFWTRGLSMDAGSS